MYENILWQWVGEMRRMFWKQYLKDQTKRKTGGFGYIKIKDLCSRRESIGIVNGEPEISETEEGIICSIYKKLLKISKRNAKYPIEKWAENKNLQLGERNVEWLNLTSNWRIVC